ncbi:alanine racemase [Sphingomonas sp. CROZ-RG-20F-R02-07]|uniref:alanine racemase n=1 Tax=Sphingomonas sp. CROZ-RG-20F-R02-07 TaxID=2914832 RepID=UPI001F5A4ABD|nr:alanine racemase [Sphingomonas sp. CROZ-RG-20F-R02-07]
MFANDAILTTELARGTALRLRLDAHALCANWSTLARMSGRAACGAAVKANGYGLGSLQVIGHLLAAGCRDFFVTTWAEAAHVDHLIRGSGASLSVLHGVRAEDLPSAREIEARPVLNTAAQIMRWREVGGGACDVMVDTGFNRLGVSREQVADGLLDGLAVETLMSHLIAADEDSAHNERQRLELVELASRVAAKRMSLANSAGIALGEAYRFDLTRPGIALYGGVPRPEFDDLIKPVVSLQAEVLQRRRVSVGSSVGYNAIWVATAPTEIAILNIGYADGYPRSLSGRGIARLDGVDLPVIGRVSMDLLAVDVSAAPDVHEGDWLALAFSLPVVSRLSDRSQYELLTSLGDRFTRVWVD